jgi:hypothetical protein
VQVLPPGVYIAMNGQHFPWDACRKNRETGVFERTSRLHDAWLMPAHGPRANAVWSLSRPNREPP